MKGKTPCFLLGLTGRRNRSGFERRDTIVRGPGLAIPQGKSRYARTNVRPVFVPALPWEGTFRKKGMESPFLGNRLGSMWAAPRVPRPRSRLPTWVTSGERSAWHFVPLRQRQCIVMTGCIDLVPGDAVGEDTCGGTHVGGDTQGGGRGESPRLRPGPI